LHDSGGVCFQKIILNLKDREVLNYEQIGGIPAIFLNTVAIIFAGYILFSYNFTLPIYSNMESDHCYFTSIESEIRFTIYNTSPPAVI
jgi:hypothetical protein